MSGRFVAEYSMFSVVSASVLYMFAFVVGYAWLPLLKEGRLTTQEFNISVSSNLPPGYLGNKDASNTKVSGET